MASFPTPFAGSVALYPVTTVSRRPVAILQFSDFTEQRWKRCVPLARFRLDLQQITYTELSAIRTFFDSVKGGFDSTWDITLNGVTYTNMTFETDTLESREIDQGIYSLTLPCRQIAA